MAKFYPNPHVLVLGDHPAAYLAAALLRENAKLHVLHSTIPGEPSPDRLCLLNPDFFDLHPLVSPLKRKLDCKPIYGVHFLADDAATRSEYRAKAAMAEIVSFRDMRGGLRSIAAKQDVELASPKALRIHRLDEHGADVTLNNEHIRCKGIILAGRLDAEQERMLRLPESWEQGIVYRYSFVKLRHTKGLDFGNRPQIPISLDLRGMLIWAWMIPSKKYTQLAVAQPVQTLGAHRPADLLEHWGTVLKQHDVLSADVKLPMEAMESLDMPMAGALAHEGVGNRTLLIGPAGGFYAASGEDLYPNCWSALFAADAMKRALREVHLQDALQIYRQKWRTTLGQYLRGPQQNLRFLLPLIYRNQVMTMRLAEAVLQGRSVVR